MKLMMTLAKEKMETDLRKSQILSLDGLGRLFFRAVSGELWISAGGRDYVLRSGEELAIRGRDKVLVEALRDSRIRVSFQ